MAGTLRSIRGLGDAYGRRLSQLEKSRENGKK